MFIMHISAMFAYCVFMASTVLIIWCMRNKGDGSFLGKTVGIIVFFLSFLSIICISAFGIKYWTQGKFETPMEMPMSMHKEMMQKMMGNMGSSDNLEKMGDMGGSNDMNKMLDMGEINKIPDMAGMGDSNEINRMNNMGNMDGMGDEIRNRDGMSDMNKMDGINDMNQTDDFS